MKRVILFATLLSCFLFITPQVSAHSDDNNQKQDQDKHEDHNKKEGHDDFFHRESDRFNNWWHNFRNRNKHHDQGRGDHDDNDEHDEDDDDDVVSAPEFGGLTGPVAFAGSAIAFVISKKRGVI